MSLIAELRKAIGRENVLSAPSEVAVYADEGDSLTQSLPAAVVFPRSVQERDEVAAICGKHNVAVVARETQLHSLDHSTPSGGSVVVMLTRLGEDAKSAINQQQKFLPLRAGNERPTACEVDIDNAIPFNAANPAAEIPYEFFTRCNRCGQCMASCPTFAVLGDENDSPRGRIRLMQMVADGAMPLTDRMRKHLDSCLDCRACETACPEGVPYGRMIEPFRLAVQQNNSRLEQRFDWFRELILFRLLPHPERLRKLLMLVRPMQQSGVFDVADRMGLLNAIPGRLGRIASLLPRLEKPGPKLPKFLPAIGRKRARVAFFVGCVADAAFRPTHWATLRVLQENGCDVFIPPEQGCCGAIHLRAGDGRNARRMADANLVAFELDRYDAIVVNHAGCSAMMKEYGLHWRDGLQPHRAKFAAKVKDVHEFLDSLGMVPPPGRIEAIATYHDSCRLAHAQGIMAAPRRLLARIPGLDLRELPECSFCCGSAGGCNLNEPELSDRLASRKIENILSTGAQIVLAANAGCLLQIDREIRRHKLPLIAMHPMDLLDMSYRGVALPVANVQNSRRFRSQGERNVTR